jgi:hypothetical protein
MVDLQRQVELPVGGLEVAELERLDVVAGKHRRLGGVAILALQISGDQAAAAAPLAAADEDGGFQAAASRSRSAKPISGQSWRIASS